MPTELMTADEMRAHLDAEWQAKLAVAKEAAPALLAPHLDQLKCGGSPTVTYVDRATAWAVAELARSLGYWYSMAISAPFTVTLQLPHRRREAKAP